MKFIVVYLIILGVTCALAIQVADQSGELINNLMQQAIEAFP